MKLLDRIMLKLGWVRKPEQKQRNQRVCYLCGKQIKRNHRWYYADGNPRHINCDKPTAQRVILPAAQMMQLPINVDG